MTRLLLCVFAVFLMSGCASTHTSTTGTTIPESSAYDPAANIKATLVDGQDLEIFIDDTLILKQDVTNKNAINGAAVFNANNEYHLKCEKREGFNFSDLVQCQLLFAKQEVCVFEYWVKDIILDRYDTLLTCGDHFDVSKERPKQ